MDLVGGGILGVAAVLAFFGGLALLMWIDGRNKGRERQLAHAERVKSLEMGQTLPDAEVARASASAQRAWAVGLVALLVPLGLAGTAVGATALIFIYASAGVQLPLLCVIWGVCGVVSLVTVTTGLGVLAVGRRESPTSAGENDESRQPAERRPVDPLATSFREEVRFPG
jgi:hypothetical protein